ncbi:hypothetical protein ABIA33_007080 [Streptacidiphilus sp. MAP12-16]|uniref:hypothetical protein n=1 Tax=Streptacidiphilus sp. MAP12-16 TaxID=3156300 RepID=UPI003511695C
MRTALVALLAVLAAVGVGAAARDHRPAPFGDAVVTRSAGAASADALRRGADDTVQLYDRRSGQTAWSYRRPGRVPVHLFPLAGTTVAVWDDGMLTGIRPEPPSVRWHRFVPGLADWIEESEAPGAASRGILLAPMNGGAVFLLLTPQLVVEYSTEDGAIRADTLPPPGCAYDPARALAVDDLVVLARPCDRRSTVDAFGPDGRRWQALTSPLARPVSADATSVGVRDVPRLLPETLDRATGHPLPTPGL